MRCLILLAVASMNITPAEAQMRDSRDQGDSGYGNQQDQPLKPLPLAPSTHTGRTADTGAGQIGQRQSREQAASNIEPLGRIDNRIANRVQNRIRNRIDKYYNPQANAVSPFSVASEQARAASRQPNR